MKRILVQLDGDRAPSVFDAITAYDAGVDVVLQHGGMDTSEVRDLVYGAMFTRGPKDLKNSAVFIGGIDVGKGESMLRETTSSFFGPLRVSVMLDANGCNTTATAAVVKIISTAPVKGRRVVVLAGTGPVGQRAAVLFAKEGADVVLTSRTQERAKSTCDVLQQRFDVRLAPAAAGDPESTRLALDGAHAVLCTGVEGVSLVSEEMWRGHETLQVLGDVNAVPPLGLEGTKPTWDGEEVGGKRVFGALAIGDLKMKVHRRCIQRLFEQNDLVLDVEEIEEIAKELV